MNGYMYEVNWYNSFTGNNSETFLLKTEALKFARAVKYFSSNINVLVYRVKFGCKTKIWGRVNHGH